MIKVTFDTSQVLTALRNFTSALNTQKVRVPMFMSRDYARSVQNNIVTQKYTFTPYNKGYAAWKQKTGRNRGFWRLTDSLLNKVEAIKLRTTKDTSVHFGGINGGKEAVYGTKVEEGIGTRGPRRLFQYTYEDYVKKGALERVDIAAKLLRGTWR